NHDKNADRVISDFPYEDPLTQALLAVFLPILSVLFRPIFHFYHLCIRLFHIRSLESCAPNVLVFPLMVYLSWAYKGLKAIPPLHQLKLPKTDQIKMNRT